jgi:hypothetical protein
VVVENYVFKNFSRQEHSHLQLNFLPMADKFFSNFVLVAAAAAVQLLVGHNPVAVAVVLGDSAEFMLLPVQHLLSLVMAVEVVQQAPPGRMAGIVHLEL